MGTSARFKAGCAAVCMMFAAACAKAPPPVSTAPPPVVLPGHAGPAGIYPDSSRTPGLANPDITQSNIQDTICSKTWSTRSIRPPSSYTTNLKKMQMMDWGLPGTTADYEEDHLVSLEAGGHPRDPRNLWPEKWNIPEGSQDLGARAKDKVENYIHDEICFSIPNHKTSSDQQHPALASVTLARGQEILAKDWYACYVSYLNHAPCP